MTRFRFLAVGAVLAAVVVLAVATAVAQPSDRAREQVERSRPWITLLDGRSPQIGVTVEDTQEGVRIGDVDDGSPAAEAGLLPGDIVRELDGEPLRSARQFSRLIQETADGRSVALGITRGGQQQTVTVTPESRQFGLEGDWPGRSFREFEPRLRELEPRWREFRDNLPEFHFDFDALPFITSSRSRLGVQLNPLSSQLAEYFGATDGGVLVSSVFPGSAAETAGLRAGDVITSVDGVRVRSSTDVIDALRDKEGDVTIGYVRDKKTVTTKATLEDRRPRTMFRRPA